MRKYRSLFLYGVVAAILFCLDRITKSWAMLNAAERLDITPFFSFDLVINRGVTAGMFQSNNPFWFVILSVIIGSIILALAIYTYYRWRAGAMIIGEIMTLAGAISNLCDRYFFDGVIDFIHFSFLGYSFPIFNVADICIVGGVFIMLIMHMKEDA